MAGLFCFASIGTENAFLLAYSLNPIGEHVMQCKCCGAHAELSVSNLISAAEQAADSSPSVLGTTENLICLSCAESALDGLEQLSWLRNAHAGNRLSTWRRLWASSFGRASNGRNQSLVTSR